MTNGYQFSQCDSWYQNIKVTINVYVSLSNFINWFISDVGNSYIRSTYSMLSNYMWSEQKKKNNENILFSSFQDICLNPIKYYKYPIIPL